MKALSLLQTISSYRITTHNAALRDFLCPLFENASDHFSGLNKCHIRRIDETLRFPVPRGKPNSLVAVGCGSEPPDLTLRNEALFDELVVASMRLLGNL